jgi:hypothetical protein
MSGTDAWNDPELMNKNMKERGFEPWVEGTMADEIDRAEQAELPMYGERTDAPVGRVAEDGQSVAKDAQLGRVGSVTTGVVLLAIVTPFIGILWFWAIDVMQGFLR